MASGNGSAGGGEAFDVDAENSHLNGGVAAETHGRGSGGSGGGGGVAGEEGRADSAAGKVARTPL